jgi:hypothetical protein
MKILDKEAIREIEDFVKKRIEEIVFSTSRSKAKVKGGNKIDDDSGKLRASIKNNKNFITQTKKGFEINLKVMEYFKFLDDQRRDELNWYLTEAIFDDKELRDYIKDQTAKSAKRVILKEIQSSIPK